MPPRSDFSSNLNCWAEIDCRALATNARLLAQLGARVMAVVKAGAYGHSLDIAAPVLLRSGITDFGVATAAEGAGCRALLGGGPNIYVMTAAAPDDSSVIVENSLTPFVSSRDGLESLRSAARAAGRTVDAHLEVDTGIGRAGLLPSEVPAVLNTARSMPEVAITGICTHFACGEDAADAQAQHSIFEDVLRSIPGDVLANLTIHASNSPAILNVPGARYSMIRPGLLLYGIAPVAGERPRIGPDPLLPVLSLRARVILVREMPAGTTISYGRTFMLDHPARIATVGIGYGDGYSRRLSNIGEVLLPDGRSASIRGRVCMDQICVELPPDAEVKAGDTVTLVGSVAGAEIRAADIAGKIEATPHEITTCLTQRVARIAVEFDSDR